MTIGWTPRYEVLILPQSPGDFIFSRSPRAGMFPAGTTAWIQWENGPTWTGLVTDTTASWNKEPADHVAIASGQKYTIFLSYPTGPSTSDVHPWMVGHARRLSFGAA